MKAVLAFIQKTPFQTLLFVAGLLFVLISTFRVDNLGKGQLAPYPTPLYPTLIFGVSLVASALCAFAWALYLSWELQVVTTSARIEKNRDCIVARVGESSITLVLGRLEESVTDPSQALVVLPANERFDTLCFSDTKSALGAFVQAKFPGKTHQFESLVRQGLASKATTKVVLGANMIDAYALGTTVYLDRPLNEGHRMLLAAATAEQEGRHFGAKLQRCLRLSARLTVSQ